MTISEKNRAVFDKFKEVLKVSEAKKVKVDEGVFVYQVLHEGGVYHMSELLYFNLMEDIRVDEEIEKRGLIPQSTIDSIKRQEEINKEKQ